MVSIEVSAERKAQLRNIRSEHGMPEAKKECKNLSEKLAVEDLSPDFFLCEAKALAHEMENNQDMNYMAEKVRNIINGFAYASRNTKNAEYWNKIRDAFYD